LIKDERDRQEKLNKGGMYKTGYVQRKMEKEERERLEVEKPRS
jgi:hypothetical protein